MKESKSGYRPASGPQWVKKPAGRRDGLCRPRGHLQQNHRATTTHYQEQGQKRRERSRCHRPQRRPEPTASGEGARSPGGSLGSSFIFQTEQLGNKRKNFVSTGEVDVRHGRRGRHPALAMSNALAKLTALWGLEAGECAAQNCYLLREVVWGEP